MERIVVTLGERSYPITIASGLFNEPASFLPLKSGEQVMLVTNETLAPLYLDKVRGVLEQAGVNVDSVILPDGEQYKSLAVLDTVFTALLQKPHGRDTTLVALGGGVVGDLTGFAAASYQRGVRFIQVPTTLLSQVDSSVGGKTAVNHPLGKNMIGAFYQPQAVLADLTALQTLPQRELSAGMAEVIKYGALGDAEFFAWLEENMADLMAQHQEKMAEAVYHCCKMKADIVAQDETEQGIRAWLNLGHTFGHAIEAEMGYGVWLHGEAVAAGCVLASRLSQMLGKTQQADTDRIAALMEAASLPSAPPVFSFEKWIEHMSHDKKVSSGIMRFVGLEYLGKANITEITDMEILRQTLQPYL